MRNRRERIPFGVARSKMARPERKGFTRRWVNDTAGNVDDARLGGYQHVRLKGEDRGEDERNVNESMTVGVNDDGTPMRAYLMEIPNSFYNEDQALKQEPLDQFDQALRRGKIEGAHEDDKDSYYVPKQGIIVETGTE